MALRNDRWRTIIEAGAMMDDGWNPVYPFRPSRGQIRTSEKKKKNESNWTICRKPSLCCCRRRRRSELKKNFFFRSLLTVIYLQRSEMALVDRPAKVINLLTLYTAKATTVTTRPSSRKSHLYVLWCWKWARTWIWFCHCQMLFVQSESAFENPADPATVDDKPGS